MGLTKKILLFTALLTVGIVVATLGFSTAQANALAQTNLSERLTSSRDIWDAFQADRLAKLRLGVRTLGNEPTFKALIESRDAATIADTLLERSADLGANFFMATDPSGLLIARSDKPTETGTDLSKDPVVAMSVQGEEAVGLWQEGERMFHAVSTPLSTGENQQGVLIAGYALDGSVAKSLARLTGADIAFLTGANQDVTSSSLGPLEPALGAALKNKGAVKPSEAFDLVVAGEKYRATSYPLENAAHRPVGSLVVLASYAREMAPFIRFRNALFIVGGLMTVLGLMGAQLIARRITDPILLLVDRVHKARDGSFAGAIPVHSTDEVGSLAKAFNGLLNELREKEQFIEFMRTAQASGGTTNLPPASDETIGLSRATTADPSGSASTSGAAMLGGDANLTLGSIFANRYKVVETLGRGGMGVVFRAKDNQLDEMVALKTLRSDVLSQDPTLLQRFKLEIKLARKITHKNVLRTHDFGEWEGTPYISMEYLEGVTLKDLQKRKGALPLGVGLQIAKQMCHGLAAAHAEGVVHRDIKPQNMLIIPETGDLKIMDFGIATVSNVKDEKKPDSAITGAGMVLGTPDYLPPELGRGQSADFRSDIYCMGVVLFELFCGKLPFTGASPLEIVLAHMQTPPPAPRSIKPGLPVELEGVILRCLEKDPQKRFQTVESLTEALNAISERQAA
jgi:predicted Ser/Thr protein kinase/HAMP domain-containing protein